MNLKRNLFSVGSVVTWNSDAPSIWRVIWTPGPMRVVKARWHDGKPSVYSLKFGADGMGITPGWMLTVEYPADEPRYYDPPLSTYLGKDHATNDVHEKWLMLYTYDPLLTKILSFIKSLDGVKARVACEFAPGVFAILDTLSEVDVYFETSRCKYTGSVIQPIPGIGRLQGISQRPIIKTFDAALRLACEHLSPTDAWHTKLKELPV